MMSFEYWFMMPLSILIATVAMASGVEGATFFAPLFILGLGLPTDVAIGTGLITEVFGFSSGLFAYIKRKLIDYKLAKDLLVVTIPVALLGTFLGGIIPSLLLKLILGLGLILVALSFLRSPHEDELEKLDHAIQQNVQQLKEKTCLTTASGETICYKLVNRNEGRFFTAIGSLFLGMISTGLGEMNGYLLLKRCKIPTKVAVASSVLIVAVSALSASVYHVLRFVQAGEETLLSVSKLLIFTIPGVLIGGQLGPIIASRIPQKRMEKAMGILFMLVALVMLIDVLLRIVK